MSPVPTGNEAGHQRQSVSPMDNIAATTRPLHTGPGPDGDEHTPLKGCASTSGDHQEAPSVFWTVQKPRLPCSHHKVMPPMTMLFTHPKTTLYMRTKTAWPMHSKVMPYAHHVTALYAHLWHWQWQLQPCQLLNL